MSALQAVLSPALMMRGDAPVLSGMTRPRFLSRAVQLAGHIRKYSPAELETMFCINPELALKAYALYQRFDPKVPGLPAALAYHGLAYRHLDAQTLDADTLAYAQEHLCILSALYGVLRPMDEIQPHRLEMDCRLRVGGGDLYAFWGDRLYRTLARQGHTLVNLASGEYTRAFEPYLKPGDRYTACVFLSPLRGRLLCKPTMAKMARGQMARFIVQHRLRDIRQLQAFDWGGFAYDPYQSTPSRLVFVQQLEA